MAEVAGFEHYINAVAETTWGTFPGSPVRVYTPYTEYSVFDTPQSVEQEVYTGHYDEIDSQVVAHTVGGGLSVNAYGYHVGGKSILQHFLEWCNFGPRTDPKYLPSKSVEFYDAGNDNKLHTGLRVASATLAGSNEGNRFITLAMQLQGKKETGGVTVGAVPSSQPYPQVFLFTDALLSVGGENVQFRNFQLQLENNVQVKHENSPDPSHVFAGKRRQQVSFGFFKKTNVWDVINRATGRTNRVVSLLLKGVHQGTGPAYTNYTTVQFDWPLAAFKALNNQVNMNDLDQQTPTLLALKPNTSAELCNVTYGTSA